MFDVVLAFQRKMKLRAQQVSKEEEKLNNMNHSPFNITRKKTFFFFVRLKFHLKLKKKK